MTRKAALIIDPEWRLQATDLNQYMHHVKTQLGQLPPIDFLMTACSRDDEHWIPGLFVTIQGWQQQSNTPHPNSVHSPHFPNAPHNISRWNRSHWLQHRILSAKLTHIDPKTKQTVPLPNRILANTNNGLININAGVDAVTRMLTNTKHKIDQIIIIDPLNRIGRSTYFGFHTNPTEVGTAHIYTQVNPHIPLAVIV